MPALAFAAPIGATAEDWTYPSGNSWAHNYSPQTQINTNNVDNLEVKWIFPLGSMGLAPDALQSISLRDTTTIPPVIYDGKVFIRTNFGRMYSIDAETGKQLWTYDYTLDMEEVRTRIPDLSPSLSFNHHGIRYWESENVILDQGVACDFFGVNIETGEEKFRVKDLCVDIPGNMYPRYGGGDITVIATYEKGRQFVTVTAGTMHSTLRAPDSRHVTMGISMDTYDVEWRVFGAPPHGVLTKDWALQECDIGYFHIYSCTSVAAQNRAGLEWDFALEGEPPSVYAGVTANWGQPLIDEDTGMFYTETGNQGPYSNMSLAPGPRLYGSAIYAVDLDTGQRAWWLQPFPHDPYDYDCNWGGFLADNPTLGKVYVKGCKEGVFYVIDAETGVPVYTKDSIQEMIDRNQIGPLLQPGDPSPGGAIGGMYIFYRPDPNSYHDMREWNWISWPATQPGEKGEWYTLPVTVVPSWSNGHFVTDMSFDPTTQTLYHFAAAAPRIIREEFPSLLGNKLFNTARYPVANESIVARDLTTGDIKWTFYHDYSQSRAAITLTGGMAFTGFTNGDLQFLSSDTGELLHTMNMGAALTVQPTIGKDSSGDSKIFTIVGATARAGQPPFGMAGLTKVPGTLVAIGLSDAAEQAQTVTTTSVSTVSSTNTVSVSVTESVTEEVGLSSTITYAAIAVAVIAVIGAAVLITRKS
jgi:outer membrane protein assembly factor BamB